MPGETLFSNIPKGKKDLFSLKWLIEMVMARKTFQWHTPDYVVVALTRKQFDRSFGPKVDIKIVEDNEVCERS